MFDATEYDAVRRGVGLLDLRGRGRIVLHGRDRKTFLHALLTNDVAALEPGTGCYAALLSAQGRMLADMHVFDLGDVTLLDVHREDKDSLLARFDALIFTEDVQLGDVSDAWGSAGVHGVKSASALGPALQRAGASAASAADLAAWKTYQSRRLEVGDEVLVAARVDAFGVPGYNLYATPAVLARLHDDLIAANAVEVAPETAEVLRIEAGCPRFHVDMTEDTIPLEAGIESRALSFTKGCYPGQEVIIRILHRGQGRVLRRLCGLVFDRSVVPAGGDEILAGEKTVGHVTSACLSPLVGKPVALGYVHRDFVEPGTRLVVAHGGDPLTAAVAGLPFV